MFGRNLVHGPRFRDGLKQTRECRTRTLGKLIQRMRMDYAQCGGLRSVVAPLADAEPFDLITRPTELQRKAFKLLGVRLERTQ